MLTAVSLQQTDDVDVRQRKDVRYVLSVLSKCSTTKDWSSKNTMLQNHINTLGCDHWCSLVIHPASPSLGCKHYAEHNYVWQTELNRTQMYLLQICLNLHCESKNCTLFCFSHNFVKRGSIFTCVSYAEARNRYRLSVCPSVCLSVRHTLVLYQNGWT